MKASANPVHIAGQDSLSELTMAVAYWLNEIEGSSNSLSPC